MANEDQNNNNNKDDFQRGLLLDTKPKTKKPSMYSSETAYYTTRLLINTLMRFLNGMIYSWTWMTEMANSLDPIQVYLV